MDRKWKLMITLLTSLALFLMGVGCAPKDGAVSKDSISNIIGEPTPTPDSPTTGTPKYGPGQTDSFTPAINNNTYENSIGGQFKISNTMSLVVPSNGSIKGFTADDSGKYFLYEKNSVGGVITYSILKYLPDTQTLLPICQFLRDQNNYGGLQFDGESFFVKAYSYSILFKQINSRDCTTTQIEIPSVQDADGLRPKYYDFSFMKVLGGFVLPAFDSSLTRLKHYSTNAFRFTTYAEELRSGVEKLRFDSMFASSKDSTWVVRSCESINGSLCLWLMKNDGSRLAWAQLPSAEYSDFKSGYYSGESTFISSDTDNFYFVWTSGSSIHLYQLDVSRF